MIPIAVFLGLIGGLIPRYRWWSVPVIGLIWSAILTMNGGTNLSPAQIWVGGFAFGAANGAVGVAVTWAIITVIGRLRSRGSQPPM